VQGGRHRIYSVPVHALRQLCVLDYLCMCDPTLASDRVYQPPSAESFLHAHANDNVNTVMPQDASSDAMHDFVKTLFPVSGDIAQAEKELIAQLKARGHARDLGESESDEGTPPKSSFEKQLEAAVKSGSFDVRGPLGQRFQQAYKKGAPGHEQYAKKTSHKEKADFRAAWAKEQYEKLKLKKVHVKGYQKIDTTKGVYKPFSIIVQHEGGRDDPEAVLAAKRPWGNKQVWLPFLKNQV
jgi:hypothetical protein